MSDELMQEKKYQKQVHHSFDIGLAEKYGIELAILIQHFQFWIQHNATLKINHHEGRTWSFDSLESIAAHYPYWSRDQVNRYLRKLVDENILMKGNFNQTKFDRTVWYAFVDEQRFGIRQIDMAKSPNGDGGIATPIPDTKPYTEKDISKDISKKGGKPPANAPPLRFIKRALHVKTTEEEHQKLIAKFGLEKTQACYQRLSEWKQDTPKGKWKKSDYRSILRWVGEAIGEDEKKKRSTVTARHRQGSKLAFETEKDNWTPPDPMEALKMLGKKGGKS